MRKFCLLALLCPIWSLCQTNITTLLKGQIRSATSNTGLPDALIYLSKARTQTYSDGQGNFQIAITKFPDTIRISLTGFINQAIPIEKATVLNIVLEPITPSLLDVEVQTGYQSIPAERATGSFVQIKNDLLNRRVGANILDRLDGIASGLIFNRSRTPNANESNIQIRGRSTIFANTEPLIIIDNFPYEGDINQINPNDIESITLLKDAAAASIWGVRAGNGVIVITTKKAKASAAPKIQFNTNITLSEKPNLFYQPIANAGSVIEMESFLFERGFYNNRINQRFPGLSPAVVIMDDRRAGRINAADSGTRMQELLATDNRHDLTRYFYRPALAQQYALTLSGGDKRVLYHFATSWDQLSQAQHRNEQNRITLRSRTQFNLIPDRLELITDLNLIHANASLPSIQYFNSFPVYQSLVAPDGTALPIYRDYRKSWLDTIGQNQLLPWHHKPYEEVLQSNHRNNRLDTRLLTILNWKITKTFQFQTSYQYESGNTNIRQINGQAEFSNRDLINRYTLPGYSNGIPTRAIPIGDILIQTHQQFNAHNGRVQMNYQKNFHKVHQFDLFAGFEIRQFSSARSSSRRYGYNQDNASDIEINPINPFPTLPNGIASRIPTSTVHNQTIDRFLSQFANLGYSFQQRYQLTMSARKDASNLFGVEANQQTVPLWSIGTGWFIHKEKWWNPSIFQSLKLRTTFGFSGNIDKTATAFTTAGNDISSVFSQPTAFLINPPNPQLRWEKISTTNLGIDFTALNGKISGSFEYYIKEGRDLIGASPIAPQAGVTQFRQNIADLQTKGWDLILQSTISQKNIRWQTQLLVSYNRDEIKRYLVAPGQTKFYLTNITNNPYEGKPWSAIFAYPFAGLDPATGNPMGWLNNTTSTNFNRLVNPAAKNEFTYIGSGRPTFFGGWRNDLNYANWSISINIVYSLGYYFRRPSIQYGSAFNSSQAASPIIHGDYHKRWRNPGDEAFTQIPSMIYPNIPARDEFYLYSQALIEKGDHIRLRDIRLTWELPLKAKQALGLKSCRIYSYINNIGILWRANKANIDPDHITGFPNPRSYAIGVQLDF